MSADAFFYWHFNGFHLKRSLNHALAIYLKNPYFVIKSANCKNQFFKYTEKFCKNHTPKYMTHLKGNCRVLIFVWLLFTWRRGEGAKWFQSETSFNKTWKQSIVGLKIYAKKVNPPFSNCETHNGTGTYTQIL